MKIAVISGAEYALGWGRSQNIAREFHRRGHEVFYLNAVTPLISGDLLSKREERITTRNLHLYSQKGLPHVRFPFLKGAHKMVLELSLNRFLSECHSVDLLLFYGVPEPWVTELLLGSITYTSVAYDCADDKESTFRDLKGEKSGNMVRDWEEYLLRQVDFAVGMSSKVCEGLSKHTKAPVYRIENGVDLGLFSDKPSSGDQRKNRVVYAGAINNRINIELLQLFAELHPQLTIDLYGNNNTVLKLLKKCHNIHYRGYVPYHKLPKVLQQYEYGLLPYRDMESIRNSSPLKVLQYFACGLKVLSFPFPVWPELERYITIINGGTFSGSHCVVPSTGFLNTFSWKERVSEYIDLLKEKGIS